MAALRRLSVLVGAVVVVVALVAACGGDGGDDRRGGLGGDASVRTLARAPLGAAVPPDAGWIAWRVTLRPGERVEHRHAFSTVYAERGPHALTSRGMRVRLDPSGVAAVEAGERHVHAASG